MKSRVFIGSSGEAIGLAHKIASAIEEAAMIPLVWDTDAFPVGSTLLEQIESLAEEADAAILLFTPDVHSTRAGRTFEAPVSNVMFEYGYLSARLTRERVAICRFENADLPSDLHGVKIMDAGSVGYRPLEDRIDHDKTPDLPTRLVRELNTWLERLPRLADCLPPIVQMHGYSGTWRIDTRFEAWRGMPVIAPNEVFWYGFTSLFIPSNGRSGKGVMWGSSHIKWAEYRSRYDVVNEVRKATVNQLGILTLRVSAVRRQLAYEQGPCPDERLRADLPDKEFDIRLEPTTLATRELRGGHRFTRGTAIYQAAVEQYIHID